jgi:hypothetical protein
MINWTVYITSTNPIDKIPAGTAIKAKINYHQELPNPDYDGFCFIPRLPKDLPNPDATAAQRMRQSVPSKDLTFWFAPNATTTGGGRRRGSRRSRRGRKGSRRH